ncbi:S-layer homology domain-containing protein [Butyricicoccus pullicaecorum]|uniref:S-layer homology domain-containing protein n=1 Tax=Butyricicoccus pullicaecorum TaxID=501571 RepID=UPI001FA8BC41|nr:S-layer homology domain-containing protein [Butyricicoccus pullicaecorum]
MAGQNAVLTIPVDLANAEITNYSSITVDGTDASIVDGTPTRDKNVITAKIKSGATNGQTANVKIMLTTKGYGDVTLTYTLTVADSKQQLTSSQINFASKTVTADGKTYFKLDNASLNGVTDTNGKWTYAVKGVSTLSEQSEMPSFKDAGVYTIVASYQGDKYVGSKEATLTIKPAVKSTITVSASQLGSSYDDNHKYWDLDKRGSGDGYLNLRADADDYLVNQRINGRSSEWIGMTISPEVSGTAKASGLWVSTNQSTWYELKKNDTLSLSDFYIRDIGDKTFDLWYDTDDRDCHDSLYLATDSKGSNKFEIYVDFNSYSGSSSSSSGSSSSDTSKVNGDRVSTTTVDKTPSVKNGSATVTFSSSALSDALDANKKEAKREDADKTYIELDVKTSKSVDDTTITVPRSSLDKIADEDTGLKLTTNQGTVTFDYRALAEIYDACDKTNIEFYLEEDDDDQYVLLIKDGSSDVIDLGRGSVEVTFDYKLKSGEKSSDVKVYRIGNGDKTWLSTYGGSTVYGAADVYAAAPTYVTDMKADYSSSKKKVTFTTDALGTFLITTDTLKTGSGSTTTTPTYNAFVDVPSSRWSATYINKLASLGIINGTGGGYFEPTLYVTREEFVKMLAGVAGANVTGYTSSRFPDVSLSRWSAPYIAWAADRGITTGTDGGNFAPTMRITREEMATMIYRYVQSSGKTLPAKNAPVIFADANLISGWAQTPVSVMQQAGIIDGNVTNGRYTFDPKVSASREECAKMLAVLYDLVR